MERIIFLIAILILLYGSLWRIFTLAGVRGWYALIPVWVFYCWAHIVRMKHPLYCGLMTSVFIYGTHYVMPWYARIFGASLLDSTVDVMVQSPQITILVSHTEFFLFGLFLATLLVGLYQFIRLCWRLAEAFSFGAWLAIIMILIPPLSLIVGLVIIILSRRPFRVLESPK